MDSINKEHLEVGLRVFKWNEKLPATMSLPYFCWFLVFKIQRQDVIIVSGSKEVYEGILQNPLVSHHCPCWLLSRRRREVFFQVIIKQTMEHYLPWLDKRSAEWTATSIVADLSHNFRFRHETLLNPNAPRTVIVVELDTVSIEEFVDQAPLDVPIPNDVLLQANQIPTPLQDNEAEEEEEEAEEEGEEEEGGVKLSTGSDPEEENGEEDGGNLGTGSNPEEENEEEEEGGSLSTGPDPEEKNAVVGSEAYYRDILRKYLQMDVLSPTEKMADDEPSGLYEVLPQPALETIQVCDKIADDSDECSICLNRLSNGKEIKRTMCSHTFHNECICKWLSMSDTCPNCRFVIL